MATTLFHNFTNNSTVDLHENSLEVITLTFRLCTVVLATFIKLHWVCKRVLKYFHTTFATRQVLVFFTRFLFAIVFECVISVVLATLLDSSFRVVFRSSQHCFT